MTQSVLSHPVSLPLIVAIAVSSCQLKAFAATPHHLNLSPESPELMAQAVPTSPQPPRPEPALEPELEFEVPEPLPPPEQLVPPSEAVPSPLEETEAAPITIVVERFEFEGNTVFTDQELAELLAPYTGESIAFSQLLEARSQITNAYAAAGYTTSGALVPPQTFTEGVVTIQIIEGQLGGINITGVERLDSDYVIDRLAVAGDPLNVDVLVERLQLLQLDPLIQTVSAELSAGVRPGTSILDVEVTEADSFAVEFGIDNNRVPSVGTFRQRVELREANLLGDGERLSVGYGRTDGSDALELGFQFFTNPRNNSTLSLRAGYSQNEVVEGIFERLDLDTRSYFLEASYRQPIILKPSEELAWGLTLSHQESRSQFLGSFLGRSIPFTSISSDDEGRTRVTALRFFQDWTRRGEREILSLRSQFNLGLDLLEPTIQSDGRPDSRFFSWRGQGQWVRLLAPDTIFLARADLQFADQALVPLEQLGLGGLNTVRGYRQDLLLTDNGFFASAEARFPILRVPEIEGLLQITPFVDFGVGWNSEFIDPDPNTLLSTGLGLLWQQGDRLSARLDFGIPLIDVESVGNSLQEDGIYFSILYTPF
ncbi:MAG: ShlB/FhaC/HecB family hemolysin secretion/activation protein [Thainema sp.]